MNEQEILEARKGKQLYLIAFVLSLFLRVADLLAEQMLDENSLWFGVIGLVGIGVLVYMVYAAWAFCRALKIHWAWSAVNAITSPFIFIFQAYFLLKAYVNRTGIKLNFLMGDKVIHETPVA